MSLASIGIGAAGGIISGIGSMLGAGKVSAAANSANKNLTGYYNNIKSGESPYTSAGSNAINTISSDQANGTGFAKSFNMGDFYNDPGYKFTLQQGTNAVNNSAAAHGGLLSGAAAKGLAGYTTGLANQTYGDAYNRYLNTSNMQYNQLMGTAQLGQTAQGQVNNAGIQIGGMQSQNTMQAGQASAAGISGMFNSLGGAVSNAGTLGSYYSMMNQGGGYPQLNAAQSLARGAGTMDTIATPASGYLSSY